MFSRVIYENYYMVFPVIAFILIGIGFLIFVFRAVFMRKSEVERLRNLPFDKDEKPSSDRTKKNHAAPDKPDSNN